MVKGAGHGLVVISGSLPQLYLIGWSCSLLDPQFVQQVCQFYITQSVWLVRLMEGCREVRGGEGEGGAGAQDSHASSPPQEGVAEAEVASRQRAVLGLVPESGVKDMCAWFRFVSLIRPTLLQALEVPPPPTPHHLTPSPPHPALS